MSTETKVELAIYDLSMGMARAMSAQFLGPENALDMIPHSAVLVFGKEYYFGGGIQSEDPMMFRRSRGNIQPVQVLMIGHTSKTKADFDAWCRSNANRFSVYTYNLLSHNCNNFAHEALLHGLGMGSGVPHWVLDVPHKVRRSPMGSLIIPMLEGMQMQGGSIDPFGNRSDNITNQESNGNSLSQQTDIRSPITTQHNPWANISAPLNLPNQDKELSSTSRQKSTKIIDAHSKYFLSIYDPNSVSMSIAKLQSLLETTSDISPNDVKEMKTSLIALEQKMNQQDQSKQLESFDDDIVVLYSLLSLENPSIHVFILLRQILLCFDSLSSKTLRKCIFSIVKLVVQDSLLNPATKGMAWMVLSNSFRLPSLYTTIFNEKESGHKLLLSFEQIVDAALRDFSNANGRKDLRLCTSMFLFNLSLYFLSSDSESVQNKGDDLPDMVVTLLCGVLDEIDQEICKETALYRLLVVALFTRPTNIYSKTCSSLLVDLGYCNLLDMVRCKFDGERASALAEELVAVISS